MGSLAEKGVKGLYNKLFPIMSDLVNEIAKLSWVALVLMLCIGGILFLFGNEHGGKTTCRRAFYGWAIIQLAGMLV